MNHKLVVTGALGHIGSKLIHSIKPGEFQQVILIDNLMTQRYASLFNLPDKVNFKFYEQDVRNFELDSILSKGDFVIHLAAITDAATSHEKKDLVEEINYKATTKVAQACLKKKAKLLFPSTTSVYGSQAELVDENCKKSELLPQSPYAESKLKAENYLVRLNKNKGLDVVICRFGTIFGPSIGMRFHTAVNKFVWQACLGEPIGVWKTALHQKRPYLSLEDAIKSIKHIIDKDLFSGDVYNVLTLNSTVDQIVSAIKKEVLDLKIDLVESQIMNQLSYEVSNQKFIDTGFKFTGNLEKELHQEIKWLRNVRS